MFISNQSRTKAHGSARQLPVSGLANRMCCDDKHIGLKLTNDLFPI